MPEMYLMQHEFTSRAWGLYIYIHILYIYIYIYIVLDILEGIDVNETRHQKVYYLPLSAFFG